MMSLSSATEIARDLLQKGELADLAAAQVEIVRMMGVRIINAKIPGDARKALNAAVKAGRLGRLAKKGLMPEAYFHPNAKWHAMELRAKVASESVEALRKVFA